MSDQLTRGSGVPADETIRELKAENKTLCFALGSVQEYLQSIDKCIEDALKDGDVVS